MGVRLRGRLRRQLTPAAPSRVMRGYGDSNVKFAAVDLPEANDLTLGIMALVAQAEREAISNTNGRRQ